MVEEKQTESVDVRETPAFRGVVRQVEELRAELAKRDAEIAARRAEEERKNLEAKGSYEQALKAAEQTWQSKYAELEGALAQTRRAHERATIESDLAAAGVVGKARQFLAEHYLSMGDDRPQVSAWIEQARIDAEFGMFFTRPKTPQPGDVGGRAAATSGSPNWDEVRANLTSSDPAKRRDADAKLRQHMVEHGKLPWQ
jgi:multidrug resistance efflux pump